MQYPSFLLLSLCFLYSVQKVFGILQEQLMFDMSHPYASSVITRYNRVRAYTCKVSTSYYTVSLEAINTFDINLIYPLQPNQKLILEYEFSFPSSSTGDFQIIDTQNSITKTAYSIDVDSVAITNEEICDVTAYPLYFRGSTEFTGVSSVNMIFQAVNRYQFIIESLRIFILPCNPTCLTCGLSDPNICLTCQTTPAPPLCSCTSTFLSEDGQCRGNCKSENFLNGSVCETNQNCGSVDPTTRKCLTCLSSFKLQNEICVKKCGQDMDQVSQTCLKKSRTLTPQPTEHLAEFYEDAFSSHTVTSKGFSIQVGSGLSNKFGITSDCDGAQLLLGHISGKTNSKITFPLLSSINHKNIEVSFLYYIIDNSSSQNIKVSVNGITDYIDTTGITPAQVCGGSILDYVGRYSNTFRFPSQSLPFSVQIFIENLTTHSAYFGIREISVKSFDCTYSTNCTQCDVDFCTECDPGYGLDSNKLCTTCYSLCDTCFGVTATECNTCKSTSQMYNTSTCLPCQRGFYFDGTTCQACDPNCYQCFTNPTTCISCVSGKYIVDNICVECNESDSLVLIGAQCFRCDPTCKTCFGIANSNCKSCFNRKYVNPSTNICDACIDNNCEICANGGVCTECQTPMKLKQNICAVCDTTAGWYVSGNACLPCHASCATCSGSAEEDCLTCASNYYYFPEYSKCIPCPILAEYNASRSSCQFCTTQCKLCSKLNVSKPYTNADFCTYCYCITCLNNKPTFRGVCVPSCQLAGQGLILNSSMNTCECPQDTPIVVDINNLIYCSKTQPFGYYCSQQGGTCVECTPHCETCLSRKACEICAEGYFLWKGICRSTCIPELSIVENKTNKICECPSGKYFTKRDPEAIASLLPTEEKECLEVLELTQIEIINALAKPRDRVNIPENPENNYFILTYNRRPKLSEFSTFDFFVMKSVLIINSDYEIVQKTLEPGEQMRSILVEIRMLKANVKVTEVTTKISTKTDRFTIKNAILILSSLAQKINSNATQKQLTSGMESVSDALSENSISSSDFVKHLISFSKEIQLLCAFSNFVQLLTPIYFLNQAMPPIVKYGSLLGASFIFEKVPAQQGIEFIREEQIVDNNNNNSLNRLLQTESDTKTYENNPLASMILSFGLSTFIFDQFLFVHILVFASVGMFIICYFGRRAFKGKQYTVYVIEKISNLVTNQLQNSITLILTMIALCFSTGEDIVIAIIYLVLYSAFYFQVAYLTLFKPTEYLFEKMPNFFIDVNAKKKGAKWSLLLSLCKKHLAIIFLLTLSADHPLVCCALVAGVFLSSALVYTYYRYFTYLAITIAKIFQELAITVLFILIAISVKEYESVIEKADNIIEDSALESSIEIANGVLITIVICIVMSFVFSTYRVVFSVKKVFDACRAYSDSKAKHSEELKLLNNSSTEIQMQMQTLPAMMATTTTTTTHQKERMNKIESLRKNVLNVSSQ